MIDNEENSPKESETIPMLPVSRVYETIQTVVDNAELSRDEPSETVPMLPASQVYGTIQSVLLDDDLLQRQQEQQETNELVPCDEEGDDDDDIDHSGSGLAFRDVSFALLFWIHIGVLVYLSMSFSLDGYESISKKLLQQSLKANHDISHQTSKSLYNEVEYYLAVYPERLLALLVLPSSFISFLYGMLVLTKAIKRTSNFFVAACLVGWAIVAVLVPTLLSLCVFQFNWTITAIVIAICLPTSAMFLYKSWRLIPFSAIVLRVALEGMSTNSGIYFVAFFVTELSLFFGVWWVYLTSSILLYEAEECGFTICGAQYFTLAALLISLYWTGKVCCNMIQVTVAGVMATWCYDKSDADTCCSPAVFWALCRSSTYSFGSICMGSLLKGFLSTIRDVFILLCMFGGCDSLAYFNQWAYVYVGLYGHSYRKSGRLAIELFDKRGITSNITDGLASSVLGFVGLTTGVITGVLGIIIQWLSSTFLLDPSDGYASYLFGAVENPNVWAFVVGFLVGSWVGGVMVNVLRGSTHTLVICWAASPSLIKQNHEEVVNEMALEWNKLFPNSDFDGSTDSICSREQEDEEGGDMPAIAH